MVISLMCVLYVRWGEHNLFRGLMIYVGANRNCHDLHATCKIAKRDSFDWPIGKKHSNEIIQVFDGGIYPYMLIMF